MATSAPDSTVGWQKNTRTGPDDWECTQCRRYNPSAQTTCTLCGYERVSEAEGLQRKRAQFPLPQVTQTNVQRTVGDAQFGVCVRNHTSHTLWFYTETTAPINWVQLRPGEACDLPSAGGLVATIAASLEEPDPLEVIGLQFAFAFGVLAFPVLLAIPEPGSKAFAVWLVGVMATSGAFGASALVMGISNQSTMKQVGVGLNTDNVWELSEDLVDFTHLANGRPVGVYSYHWREVSDSADQFPDRFAGYEQVPYGVDRGDLGELPAINSEIIDEIRHHADIGELYVDAVDMWQQNGELDEHRFPYGGEGPGTATVFAATTPGDGTEYGLISEVRVWACKFVDAIQVKYKRQPDWERPTGAAHALTAGIFSDSNSTDHGGYGGSFTCVEGEYISRIGLKYDQYVVTLEFITNKGRRSKVFGGRDGDGEYTTTVPDTAGGQPLDDRTFDWGGGWVGYQCTFGSWMDSFAFLMAGQTSAA
jgi:hypothetical protein